MIKPIKSLLTAMAAAIVPSAIFAADWNPQARPGAIVTEGNARFTVLTPEMVRIEYSPAGVFEDRATFAVVNRDLPVPGFRSSDDGEFLTLSTDKLTLRYRKGTDPMTNPASDSNLTVTFDLAGEPVVWFPGKDDPQNLRGTYRTLDGNDGDSFRERMEQGVVSRSGWAVIDDSPSAQRADGSRSLAFEKSAEANGIDWVAPRADGDALDLYFMAYGHDYKRALGDFTKIAGKIPLPPDYVFGYWYSKYDNYSADDFRGIMESMRTNDINADVLILDMDWHWNGEKEVSGGRGGWTGWSWNTNLIPDPEGLLSDIHDNRLRAALNLHPADGVAPDEDCYPALAAALGVAADSAVTIPWQLDDRKFAREFFRNVIRPLEKQGVDFWWLDWQQHLTNPRVEGLGETFWCNHVFFNEMKNSRPDRRPVIFHRWGGLGSHRYQIGFSGDSYINFPTLAFEPYFTATASNVGYGYWGHDLGGHMLNYYEANDPELLLRWMQFGVFTPIFRTHATKDPRIERRIWTYSNFPQLNETVKLRYAIFPYLYTMARKAYDTGVSLCRPMYYEYPESPEAYEYEGQYFFGDDMLVAPVVTAATDGVSSKEVWLPEGEWWSVPHARLIEGGRAVTLDYALDQIPVFRKTGSIVVNNPPEVKHVTERPGRYILDVIAGADGETSLYEDSGDSNDYATAYATTDICQRHGSKETTIEFGARRGSYEGMPSTRGYEVKLFNTSSPKGVTFNGKTVKATYDAATRCTTVSLPGWDCSLPATLVVKHK